MKLKLSCLLSVCLLMGSCSGGTSGNVSASGTSASPSKPVNTPTNTTSTLNAYGENPAAVAAAQQYLNQAYNPSPAAVAAAQQYSNTAPPSSSTIKDPVAQGYTNLTNSLQNNSLGCTYVTDYYGNRICQ
jgi:hypothetical protein